MQEEQEDTDEELKGLMEVSEDNQGFRALVCTHIMYDSSFGDTLSSAMLFLSQSICTVHDDDQDCCVTQTVSKTQLTCLPLLCKTAMCHQTWSFLIHK